MTVLWITAAEASIAEQEALTALPELSVHVATDLDHAFAVLRTGFIDAVVANTPLADCSSEDLLDHVHDLDPGVPVIIRDRDGNLADAVRLTKLGAFHFMQAAADVSDLERAVAAAIRSRQSDTASTRIAADDAPWRKFLIGESRAMQEIAQIVRLIGPRRSTVLITGETGTGKEVLARAIHMASHRRQLPLVAVNCSALPDNLLEPELFGHVKGAFTGAVGQRIGRFEQAHKGTLFLDEVADMPLDLQVKLLRVLQEREFQRVGSSESIRVDVRVIAACNVDLMERIQAGQFREDLFYRLNVVPVELPPLRDRAADIPLLVTHFMAKIAGQEDIESKRVSDETMHRLMSYAWPGNVRQLENAVEMAMVLSGDRELLTPADFRLPAAARLRPAAVSTMQPMISVPDHGLDFERIVGDIERSILEQALRKTNGNKKQAAAMLRLKRTTLSAKLKSLEAIAS